MGTSMFRKRVRFWNGGGARRDRTADLYNAIVALSQLSYGPSTMRREPNDCPWGCQGRVRVQGMWDCAHSIGFPRTGAFASIRT